MKKASESLNIDFASLLSMRYHSLVIFKFNQKKLMRYVNIYEICKYEYIVEVEHK